MLTKRQSIRQCFVVLFYALLVFSSSGIAAENQTLQNHQLAKDLNSEGYRAYRQKNWDLALKKFSQSAKLDPYYTYPLYNSACVLSLRGWPSDSFRIYRLLLETLLQEHGETRSIHQAKMQKDPDLAWFRRQEPDLFIRLNNVILNYDTRVIYQLLHRSGVWNINMGGQDNITPNIVPQSTEPYHLPAEEEKLDIGYVVPEEERRDSLTVTPDDPPLTPNVSNIPLFPDEDSGAYRLDNIAEPDWLSSPSDPSLDDPSNNNHSNKKDLELPDNREAQASPLPNEPDASGPFSDDFDPFSDWDDFDPFSSPDEQEFPGFDTESSDSFFPFVPQSLRPQYQESELTLRLVSQLKSPHTIRSSQAPKTISAAGTPTILRKDQIFFAGYRYAWRLRVRGRLFEMRGFYVIRGNVLILETFAASPKELQGLPFDWGALRSLLFIYQPHLNEFQAITPAGEVITIY